MAAPAAPLSMPSEAPLRAPVQATPAAPVTGPLTPAAAPAPSAPIAQPAPPPGFEGIAGQPIMPPNKAFMTRDEHVALNLGRKPFSELMKEGAEIERHRYEKNEGGMFDKRTGMFYPIASTGKIVDIPIYGEGYGNGDKTYKVSEENALRLGRAQANGDPVEYKRIADMATGRNFGKTAAGQPASAKPIDNSIEARALAQEQAKELAKARTSREIAEISNLEQKDQDARELITFGSQLRKFASDPDAKKMTGILSNNKVSSAIATAVEEGIGTKDFRIGAPGIQKLMRNAGLNDEQQAKYRVFLMLTVQDQLMRAKYLKGSVSNYEDQLLAAAGATDQDPVEALRIKADLYTRRGQFDRRTAREFEKSGMTAKEFLKSEKYDSMREKFDLDLAELSFGNKILANVPKPAAANPTAGKPAVRSRNLEDAAKRAAEITGD
jgi:hypothetical protein